MDAATLYLVFQIGNGPERTYIGHFGNKYLCEASLARTIKRKAQDMRVVRSVCWEHGTPAPSWIAVKVINGVPLDPAYRP